MKYLLLFLISSSVFAYPVPKPLEDAKIQVKTRDGKIHKFDANEYKVVKRGVKAAPVVKENLVIVSQRVPELKNRVTFLAGNGPSRRLYHSYYEDKVKIYTKTEPVFGFSYDRKFDGFSLRGTFLINKTYLLGFGLDF